jgi:hypothetical protein
MRSRMNDTVSAGEVHALAGDLLGNHLQLTDHGPTCTAAVLLLILLFAASRGASLYDACQRLRDAPTDQAIRDALVDLLPGMAELEGRLNRALQARLPKSLRRRKQVLAIDCTEIPYYGKPYRRKKELRRNKRKRGTSRFHTYATLYLVRHGERFTLAMTYVWRSDSSVQILQRLLAEADRLGLSIRYLLLDRGFYSVEVARWLQGRGCPFLMPVAHRGRHPKHRTLSQSSGTRRFLAWKRSGWSTHTMAYKGRQAQIRIAVVCGRRRRGKAPLVFAFWGFRPPSPRELAQWYRLRFGIESSYRQMNQGRIRTCSRNPQLRLLLVGIALVLRNLWVWLHRTVLAQQRRRGRAVLLHLELLRFRTMLLLLQRCAEGQLGCTETAEGPPDSHLTAWSRL